jgi:hypothetical protein
MITMYICVDTTGRWNFRLSTVDPAQPHLARLAWIEIDSEHPTPYGWWCQLIQPRSDWGYEPDAIVAHGITPETATERGISLKRAMLSLVASLQRAQAVVMFNADFGAKVLERSAAECGVTLPDLDVVCVMRSATDVVRKPRMAPGGGYAWPKLREAYQYFEPQRDLPSLDMDPILRGVGLCRCVRRIHQGIQEYERAISHE